MRAVCFHSLGLALVLGLLPAQAHAEAKVGLPGVSQGPCEHVALAADELVCDKETCTLRGKASVICESMRLWADTIDLFLGTDNTFNGANARGHVVLVDGNRLINCTNLTLGPDRIQARMEDATVQVKRDQRITPAGLPAGRNSAALRGRTVLRLSEDRLHVDDAVFTMCDCDGGTPSWEMTSSSIDATLDDRVTVYWPVLRINPFGLGILVPVTPPLAPLSLPLKSRAMGFLPPVILFFGGSPWPLLDFPFFVPLGRSFDLTLTPGVRTDWSMVDPADASREHHLTPLADWGAYRFGGRLRYAPTAGTEGTFALNWTHDRHHAASALYDYQQYLLGVQRAKAANVAPPAPPTKREKPTAYDTLTERLDVSWRHRSDFTDNLRFVTTGQLVSDDRYLVDFGQSPTEGAQPYLPSRAQLQWRSALVAGSVGADYLLIVSPGNTTTPMATLQHSRYLAPERGPAARLHLEPVPLLAGLHADADLSFVRYGPWLSGALPTLSARQLVGGATSGLSLLRSFGPLEVAARAGVDWMAVDSNNRPATEASTLALLSAEARTHLGRAFGDWRHIITPRLTYRAVPWRSGDLFEVSPDRLISLTAPPAPLVPNPDNPNDRSTIANPRLSDLDERLRRDRTFEQAELALSQDLLLGTARVAGLELSQPFSLQPIKPLPARARVLLAAPKIATLSLAVSAYLPSQAERTKLNEQFEQTLQMDLATLKPGQIDWREVSARLDGAPVSLGSFGSLQLGAGYNRWSPRAGRFLRTIYEIEAPADRVGQSGAWIHYVEAGATLTLLPALSITYSSAHYLPIPEPIAGEAPSGFTYHLATVSYHSPCDCWDVMLQANIPPKQPSQANITVLFSIGGYRLGVSR
jgi:hypothetical protein